MRDLSIYIHVPFCVRKCLYCDFLSFPLFGERPGNRGGKAWPGSILSDYVNLLRQEIIAEAAKYKGHQVISVFWGGGTPSLLPADAVSGIMAALREYYRVLPDAEITLEANPGTVTADSLGEYIRCGINRLSIGLQSADDEELSRIGRIHGYRTFLKTYRLAREAGFSNINVDLMAALPGQSTASYRDTLGRVAALRPEHISAYSLILEEGTPLYEHRAQYSFPTEDEEREMYLLTDAYLSSCGYHRYEISNYARDGYECRHNKVYWQRGDYVGFGLGASSMVENVRWSNPAEFDVYAGGMSAPVRQVLTRQEQMEEFMFLGLRLMCGVGRQEFAGLFGQQIEEVYGGVLDKMYGQGLLMREADRIRLTVRGIDVSNYVMAQFLLGP